MVYAAAAFRVSPMMNGATPIKIPWRSGIEAEYESHTAPAER
jgi:hypothetical protein